MMISLLVAIIAVLPLAMRVSMFIVDARYG